MKVGTCVRWSVYMAPLLHPLPLPPFPPGFRRPPYQGHKTKGALRNDKLLQDIDVWTLYILGKNENFTSVHERRLLSHNLRPFFVLVA